MRDYCNTFEDAHKRYSDVKLAGEKDKDGKQVSIMEYSVYKAKVVE